MKERGIIYALKNIHGNRLEFLLYSYTCLSHILRVSLQKYRITGEDTWFKKEDTRLCV